MANLRTTFFDGLSPLLSDISYFMIAGRVSVVIPCFNEAGTVGSVVESCRKSRLVGEVIVVDDCSTDGSAQAAKLAGARVVRHHRNKGKALAMLSGAKAAKHDAIVFIDADLRVDAEAIVDKLALPLLQKRARITKAKFERSQGRVTELTAKPLLRLLYPEIRLDQPLSGQFAITKSLLSRIEVAKGWGVDIGIVVDAYALGERIEEVEIGVLEHKHRELPDLAKTSLEVTRTILQKAGFLAEKHSLIVFDFDNTLVRASSIGFVSRQLGLGDEIARNRNRFHSGRITERELCQRIAKSLGGVNANTFAAEAKRVPLRQFAPETLTYLKRMGYSLAVISFAYKRTILSVFGTGVFDAMVCPDLESRRGILTGQVTIPAYESERFVFDKGRALKALREKMGLPKERVVAVGDSASDEEMFKEAGTSASFSRRTDANFHLDSISEVLIIAR